MFEFIYNMSIKKIISVIIMLIGLDIILFSGFIPNIIFPMPIWNMGYISPDYNYTLREATRALMILIGIIIATYGFVRLRYKND
jgi:uncharacterized membrane protein (Fun14 family)